MGSHSSDLPVVLIEKGAGGQPHPVAVVDEVVAVNQQPVEGVPPTLPGHVEVPSCEEAGDCMACQVVQPPLRSIAVASGLWCMWNHFSLHLVADHCMARSLCSLQELLQPGNCELLRPSSVKG